VKFEVWPWVYGKVMAVPPEAEANHPRNEKYWRVGLPGEVATVDSVAVDPLEIDVPP
jgi:hypothetical protein